MTQVHTVTAVTAALIAQGTVTVITAARRGIDGRVLIRAADECGCWAAPVDCCDSCHEDLSMGYGDDLYTSHGLWCCAGLRYLDGIDLDPDDDLNPNHIVASGTVEWVPIYAWHGGGDDEALLQRGSPEGDELTYWAHGDGEAPDADLTDQLPWGDFTPGRWAGILTNVKPTTERCPAHWDEPKGMNSVECWACPGMVSPDRTCPPIPCDDVKEWP